MVLAAFVTKDQFGKLDPILQAEYKPEGEGYIPNVTEATVGDKVFAFQDIGSLRKAYKAEKGNAKTHGDRLSRYKGEDGELLDPERAKEAVAKFDEMQNWDGDAAMKAIQKENSTLKAQSKKIEKENAKLTETNKGLDKSLRKEAIDNRIKDAIVESKGNMIWLKPMVSARVDLQQSENGEYRAVVLDEAGNPENSMEDPTKPMAVGEYVKSLKQNPEYALAFEGSGSSGIDGKKSGPTPTKSGGVIQIQRDDHKAVGENADKLASGEAILVD